MEKIKKENLDDLTGLKNYAGFGLLPAMRAGMVDGLSLGGLTLVVVYLLFVYQLLKHKQNIVLYSFYFISGLTAATIVITIGLVDDFLMHDSYKWTIEAGYLVVILAALFTGCMLFLDWMRMRKVEGKPSSLKISFPFLFDSKISREQKPLKKIFVSVGLSLLSLFLGAFITILLSRWPCSQHVYFISVDLMSPGRFWPGLGTFVVYGFSYCFLLWILILLFSIFLKSDKMINELRSYLSVIQIIVSAVFLGYSLALISIFYIKI